MEIKAVDVAKLRKIIREKGKLVAAKRADRETNEGAVIARITPDAKTAILVAIGCETDFVSATAEFKSLAEAVADAAMTALADDKAALENAPMPNGQTVAEFITEQAAKCGEKHQVAYYAKMQAEYIGSYIHFTKKDGAIVGFNKEVSADLAKHIAMQVTSMKPVAVDESSVPASVVEQEMTVAVEKTKEEQVRRVVDNALKKAGINPAHCDSDDHISSNTAKGWLTEEQAAQAREIIATVGAEAAANLDENKIQNIAKGRLAKFFKEQTLENQEFVMEGKISVKDYIKSVDPEAKVTGFCRFSLSD